MVNQYTQSNPFLVEQEQPQQGLPGLQGMQGGMNPSMFMGEGGMFGGGSAAGGASGAAGASGGGAASGGASGGASALSSAGPWAALAAVIIGNEYGAKEGGRRSEDKSKWAKDAISGKVLTQDAPYYAQKAFGKDEFGLGGDMVAGAELATGDFSNAWEAFKEQGTLGKLFDKLF